MKSLFYSTSASLFASFNPFTVMQNKCLGVDELGDGLMPPKCKQYEPTSDCSKEPSDRFHIV